MAHNSRIRSSNRLSIGTAPEVLVGSHSVEGWFDTIHTVYVPFVIPYPVCPPVRVGSGRRIAFARRKARTTDATCGTGGRRARSEEIPRPSCRTQRVAPRERAAPSDTRQGQRKTNFQVNSNDNCRPSGKSAV